LNRFSPLLPSILLVFVASVTFISSSANAELKNACPNTKVGAHVANQPEAWRSAVESLVASTRAPNQPWSCVGGEVDLEVHGATATLTVVDDRGHAISREVSAPEDVGPLGEALLAKPIVETEPAAAPQKPLNSEEKKPESKIAPVEPERRALRDPRALVSLTLGPRYAGPNHLLWGSFTISAAVPFRPWTAGVWLRYDGFSKALEAPVPPTRDLCIGATASWSTSRGRIEVRPALRPSLAVVTRRLALNNNPEGPGPQPQEPLPQQFRDDTQLDFRLGAQAQVLIGLNERFRAVIGLDAEASPEQVFTRLAAHRGDGSFLRLPAYTVGLDVGLEVAVP